MKSTMMSTLVAALATVSFAAPAPQITYPLPPTARLEFAGSVASSYAFFQGMPSTINADTNAGGALWILPSGAPVSNVSPLRVNAGSPDDTTLLAVGPAGPTTLNLGYDSTDGLLKLTTAKGAAFTQIKDILLPKPVNGAAPGSQWVACTATVGTLSGWNIYWAPYTARTDCKEIVIYMITY